MKRKIDSVTSFRVNPQGPAKIKTPLSTLQDVSDTMLKPSTTMTGYMDGIEANTGEIEDSDLLLAGSESDTLVQRSRTMGINSINTSECCYRTEWNAF